MFIQCWHHGNKKPGPSILTREADGNFNSPLIRSKYVPRIPSSLTLLHPLPDSTHEECNWPMQQTTSASSWWWTSSLGPMWAKRHRFDCRKWNINQISYSSLTPVESVEPPTTDSTPWDLVLQNEPMASPHPDPSYQKRSCKLLLGILTGKNFQAMVTSDEQRGLLV